MSISIEVYGFNNCDIFIVKCKYFGGYLFVAKILAGKSGQVAKVG